MLPLFMAVAFPVFTWAQTDANLIGHVLDAKTGEHLPFVNVQVMGTMNGGQTDATGHYFLKDLPTGMDTIAFSIVGYHTLRVPVRIMANSIKELNVELEEETVTLENVVVTANRYETRKKDVATIVNVVQPIEIERTAATCMADALTFQTGLRVEQTCANCGQTELRINGLEGQYSQILMDSRPIFSSLASVYGLEQIPVGMVDHVEIVRGGTSALFGSNAIGGVVNIITKESTRNMINISNTSSMLRKDAYDINTTLNASLVSENRKVGAFLFAVQRNRKQYDHDGDGFSDIPLLGSTTAGFRAYFKTSAYSKLTIGYHHVTDMRRGGNLFDYAPHEADIAEQAKHNIDAVSVKFDWSTADNHHHVSVYSDLQHVARDSYYGAGKDPNAYGKSKDLTSVSGGQYRWSYLCGKMPADLTVGAEYTYNNLKDEFLGYDRNLNQTVHTVGGFAQNEWKNDRWSALVGVRVEKHSMLAKPMFMPRANVRYTPLSWLILRAGYSSGYRAPQTYEEDLHVEAVGGSVSLISLDPNLKPETSHSINLSTDFYGNWGDWAGNVLLEGFFTRLNDVFFLREDGKDAQGNLLLTRTNASGAQVAGLNIEGKIGYKHWFDLQGGYTFQKSIYLEPQIWSDNKAIAPQKRMFRTPDHYAYWLMNVYPVKDLTLSINGKVTGSMLVQHRAGVILADEEVVTPAFVDMGVRLAYDIHLYKHYCLELSIGVKNVLGQFQSDLDQGPDRDASYIYGSPLPRTYYFGVNLKI